MKLNDYVIIGIMACWFCPIAWVLMVVIGWLIGEKKPKKTANDFVKEFWYGVK
jgi:NADH:ubiquinone oxidoreductase subunit 3 (subunit A)